MGFRSPGCPDAVEEGLMSVLPRVIGEGQAQIVPGAKGCPSGTEHPELILSSHNRSEMHGRAPDRIPDL